MSHYPFLVRMMLAASLVCLAMAVPARAGSLIITGDNTTIAPGGTGVVSFAISDSTLTGDPLAGFQLQLQITQITGTGVLMFSSANLTDYVDPFSDPNYVFYGDSYDQISGPPPGLWYNLTNSNLTATGADSTNDNANVTITSAGTFLLATVQVDATNAYAGDTYAISLSNDTNTYFQDNDYPTDPNINWA